MTARRVNSAPTEALTDMQADGLACVVCGLDFTAGGHAPQVPVGRSATGSQIFACLHHGGNAPLINRCAPCLIGHCDDCTEQATHAPEGTPCPCLDCHEPRLPASWVT